MVRSVSTEEESPVVDFSENTELLAEIFSDEEGAVKLLWRARLADAVLAAFLFPAALASGDLLCGVSLLHSVQQLHVSRSSCRITLIANKLGKRC